MAGTKINPSDVGGPNENYAQRVHLTRPDASTVGPGGNVFDRGLFSDIAGTKGATDKNSTQAKPLGQVHTTGF